MPRAVLIGLVGLLGLAQSPQAPSSSTPVVWTVSSLTRVLPSEAPGAQSAPHIYAARGESQAFQIAVRAPAKGLELRNAVASDLTGPAGRLSSSIITLYREHSVHVDTSSPNWHATNRSLGPGWYPDALIPFVNPVTGASLSGPVYRAAPFTVAASSNLTIWVDLAVDRKTGPGDYTGAVTLGTDQGDLKVPWTLTVWNFSLPMEPTLKSRFEYWNPVGQDALKVLLQHRLMPGKLMPEKKSTAPATMEQALRKSDGLNATDTGFWSGADNSHCTMTPAPPVAAFQAAAAAHAPGLYLFNYTADEIQNCVNLYPAVQQWARNMHQAGIKNLVVIPPTPQLYDDGAGMGRSAVDIWVVLPLQYEASKSAVAQVQSKGDQVWSYNALVQDGYSPKWLIDYDWIDYRMQAGFLSQALGLTGLLYWRVDLWDRDPWSNVNNTGVFSSGNYPGEGILVYPGAPVGLSGVVPSIRLKQLREGVDDYEYVAILKGLGRGDWALGVVRSVAQDWKNWTRDANALESARRQLGSEIDRLSGSAPRH